MLAKEEKRCQIQEKKKFEKDIRDKTYDERREKFRNQIKERRDTLSKTPVRMSMKLSDKNRDGLSSEFEPQESIIKNSNYETYSPYPNHYLSNE